MKDNDIIIIEHWKEVLLNYVNPTCLMENLPAIFGLGKAAHKEVYQRRNEEHEAVNIALNKIIQSNILLEEFIEALKKSGHRWLGQLINAEISDIEVAEESEKAGRLQEIRSFLTTMAPHIKEVIHAEEVADKLLSRKIITLEECQQVRCVRTQEGQSRAAMQLLCCLVRKTSEWLPQFVKILESFNYNYELIQSFKAITLHKRSKTLNGDTHTETQTFGEKQSPDVRALPIAHQPRIGRMAASFMGANSHADARRPTPNHSEVTLNSASNLREYQKYLATAANNGENVIICAPTGSGKTRVAAHIIHTRLQGSEQSHKVAFLVPRVALAKQQSDSIRSFMAPSKWKVDYLVGDSKMSLQECLRICHVVVMTPQILLNALKEQSGISIGIFNMIVFDECHHTVSESPYNSIMSYYLTLKRETGKHQLPQIIGLTATLGVGKGKSGDSAMDHILTVCASLDATGGIVTVPKKFQEDLYRYTASPEEKNIELDRISDPFTQQLSATMDELLVSLQRLDLVQMKEPIPQGLSKSDPEFLQWCVAFRNKAAGLSATNPLLCRDVQSHMDYLIEYNKAFDLYLKCRGVDSLRYLKENLPSESSNASAIEEELIGNSKSAIVRLEQCLGHAECENPNLEKIALEIKTTFAKDANSRVMFNVLKRQYARPIADWLTEDKELSKMQVKVQYFIGVGKGADGISKGLTYSVQERILEDFRSGQIKILVCTPDVASEGIDVVDCNLVILYDYTKNEISKAQVKGRARKQGGTMVQFSSRKVRTRDEANEVKTSLMETTTEKVQALYENDRAHYLEAIRSRQDMRVAEIVIRRRLSTRNLDQPSSDLFSVTCRKCGCDVCDGQDIVKVNKNHTWIKDFSRKYSKKKVDDGGTEQKYGFFCKACDSKWGIFATYKRIQLPQLDPSAFTFTKKCSPTETTMGAKWAKVKVQFKDVDYESAAMSVYDI